MDKNEEITNLLKKFFYYMDYTEESDDGKPFRPTYISSCRTLHCEELQNILARLKELINAEES